MWRIVIWSNRLISGLWNFVIHVAFIYLHVNNFTSKLNCFFYKSEWIVLVNKIEEFVEKKYVNNLM
jgi:hypothetical protein